MKLNAAQLRAGDSRFKIQDSRFKQNDIYIILDNVLDTYNIGSIFRLADAVAVKKVYLCGNTEIPPNHKIKKASINTTEIVEWEYRDTASEAIKEIRSTINDMQVIAIEQSAKSIRYDKFEYKLPTCFIVGHESYGVSKEVLNLVDGLPAGQAGIVEIPMFGVNVSLNVTMSLAIVLYEAIEKTSL